jgi:mannitol/fructose-specific phosphotransferase system IIA component (Ntr-type)
MAIVLADLLNEKHVDLDLRTGARETALTRLVRLWQQNDQIKEPEKFLEQLLARERASSSAVEHGVAFPHLRTDAVDKIILAIGRSRTGIPFGPEGTRARLIFLVGVPQRLVSDYLVVLGGLARLLKDEEVRHRLLHAETPGQLLDILRTTDEEVSV